MKAFIIPSYTFTPGASGVGTVNLSGISDFNIKYLLAIINQTRGILIYSTANASLRFTNVTGTTVTLFADTTGQSSGDVLQVVYEDQTGAPISDTPIQSLAASPVRPVGQMVDTAGFSSSGASVLDPFFNAPIVGSGVTYNQGNGFLNIVSGTTINSEFLARSVKSYKGSLRMRFTIQTSGRTNNTSLGVMLADLIGEGLSYTINSTTSVTVTVPNHTFTAAEVGQFIQFAGVTGAAAVSGRYAIASVVVGTSITFTVSGFPASGTGTCTLFGRNYVRTIFSGTNAAQTNIDAQRNGWATGDTTITINTTGSPGTLIQFDLNGREVYFSDTIRGTTATATLSSRASRFENIPDATTEMYVWIWGFNGTVSPATAVTYTLGHISVESFPNQSVFVQGVRSSGTQNPIPVFLQAGGNAVGSVGINAGATLQNVTAVNGVTTVNTLTDQTNIGTLSARPVIPAFENMLAIQSNINNIIVT